MKKAILTVATLAALSSGEMSEVREMINDAEYSVGRTALSVFSDTANTVGTYALGHNGQATVSQNQIKDGVIYAKVNAYSVRTTPYNIASANISGFGGASSFGFGR